MSDSVVDFPDLPEDPEQLPLESPTGPPPSRLAALEAIIFAAEQPPTVKHLSDALGLPPETVAADLEMLCRTYQNEARGVEIRRVAGTFRMTTKPQYHDEVRTFAASLTPRLKLSKAALETLAVVAYQQPVTLPEIQAIRGVANASSVIHTLLRLNLVAAGGRKKVIGRPMTYKTTPEFLEHFGLDDLSALPTIKEAEELALAALSDDSGIVEGTHAADGSPASTEDGRERPLATHD